MKKRFMLGLLLLAQGLFAQPVLPRDSLVADFRQFIHYLEETHPDPYTAFGGKVFFHRKAIETEKKLSEQDYDLKEFCAQIERFLAVLGDGHTHLTTSRIQQHTSSLFFPLDTKVIADGLMITGLPEAYKRYLGCKILTVNGTSAGEMAEKTGYILAAENLYGKYSHLSRNLPDLSFLQRIIPASDTLTLGVLTPAGEKKECRLKALPREECNRLKRVSCPSWEVIQDIGNMEWRFLDAEKQTMYFRLKSVMAREAYAYMQKSGWDGWTQQVGAYYNQLLHREMPANPEEAIAGIPAMGQEFRKMLETMKKEKARNLVIDLRGNGGGFTPITLPTLYQLYGDRYLQTDMGTRFYRLISPLYMQKIKQTLDDFNRNNGTGLAFGDYLGEEENPETESPDQLRKQFLAQCIGGEEEYIRDLDGQPVYTPRKIYVVTDANTFSAAFHYAFYLWKMGATVVGVPSRQAPNTFMESTPFRLPRTGIKGSISNSVQYFLPTTDRRATTFYPDWIPEYDDYVKYGFDTDTEIRYMMDRIE